MNIAKILKNCPQGTKLYCTVLGEVVLNEVCERYSDVCIIVRKPKGGVFNFDKEGKYFNYPDAECVLFPSRNQRDWSKFGVTDQVNDQETKPQFEPFDKVLVRDYDDALWRCDLFVSIDEKEGTYNCIGSYHWKQCIPYEGNEHLSNTTNKPE